MQTVIKYIVWAWEIKGNNCITNTIYAPSAFIAKEIFLAKWQSLIGNNQIHTKEEV